MALVTTCVLLGLVAWVLYAVHLPARTREARLNAELASMVDGGTAELVEEKLLSWSPSSCGCAPAVTSAGRSSTSCSTRAVSTCGSTTTPARPSPPVRLSPA